MRVELSDWPTSYESWDTSLTYESKQMLQQHEDWHSTVEATLSNTYRKRTSDYSRKRRTRSSGSRRSVTKSTPSTWWRNIWMECVWWCYASCWTLNTSADVRVQLQSWRWTLSTSHVYHERWRRWHWNDRQEQAQSLCLLESNTKHKSIDTESTIGRQLGR